MTTFFFKKIKTYEGDTGWGEGTASASASVRCLETALSSQDHLHLGLEAVT